MEESQCAITYFDWRYTVWSSVQARVRERGAVPAGRDAEEDGDEGPDVQVAHSPEVSVVFG